MTPGGVVSEMPELGPNVAGLREYLCGVGVGELYVQFASLGGEVSEFDLDAFAHSLTDLPRPQLAILDQAIWEFRQFGR